MVYKHKPISISIASNVLGYEMSYCFVNENSVLLFSEMIKYFNEISHVKQDNLQETYQHIFDQLKELIDYYSNNESSP